MSLDTFGIIRPGQNLGTGPTDANHYPEFTGEVEETIERKSRIAPHVEIKNVQGTSIVSKDGIGESTLTVLQPGVTPDQNSPNQFNQNHLKIDTTCLARTTMPVLDVFQKSYDARAKVAREHGKKIAKIFDESFAIAAIKAGRMTTNKYALPGFVPGSQQTLPTLADAKDPARLLAALGSLFAQMGEKDVDPQMDNIVVALRPMYFQALTEAEMICNGDYVTSQGVTMHNVKMLKAYEVPVIQTTSVPNRVITGHQLSNANNGNFFDGDFTKLVATAFSADAILAGQTIPLTTKVWWSDAAVSWFVDAYLAWSATVDNNAYSGVIEALA